nr:splicing factor U2af-associated protein 2 [Tanacetum cinerariifolium]
ELVAGTEPAGTEPAGTEPFDVESMTFQQEDELFPTIG